MTVITVTYTVSEAQFMHASRALWSYEAIGDTGNYILAGLTTTTGIACLIYGQTAGWAFLAIAAFLIVLTVARNVVWRRAYRKMEKYTAPITANLTADTVSTRSAQGSSDLPWSHFKAYAETPDYIFLTAPKRGLSIIPKSAFDSNDDLDQTRSFIVSNLPRKKMRWT